MIQDVQIRVLELGNTEVVNVVRRLFNEIFAQIPYDGVREYSSGHAEVRGLIALDSDTLERELAPEVSARLGRLILKQCARDSTLAPLLAKAIEKVREGDEVVVHMALPLGLVVNLTLLVATTSLRVEEDAWGRSTWTLKKKTVGPEILNAVVTPVTDAARAIAP